MKNYPKIIGNIPLPREEDTPHCPLCGSKDIHLKSSQSTMLGGGPYVNHVWEFHTCNKCGEDFIREHHEDYVWYTQDGKIIEGNSNCWERYIWTCSYCEGDAVRYYTKLDGKTPTSSLGYGRGEGYNESGRSFREFYKCQSCEKEEELVY